MSNRAHLRPRPARADRSLVDLALALAGCTCRPDLRHLGPNHTRVEHDPDCPAQHQASQYLIALPKGARRAAP